MLLLLSQGCPSQSVIVTLSEISFSIPSQKTPPSLVAATLVNTEFENTVFIAFGLVDVEVPGEIKLWALFMLLKCIEVMYLNN